MSCSVGHKRSSDPTLLWLWRRPVTTALIRLLVWEPPYAISAALKKKKNYNEVPPYTSQNGLLITLQITNAREGIEKKEYSYPAAGNINWYNYYGKQYGGSSEN